MAGSLMGGEVSAAVDDVRTHGILVVSLNMAGSVPEHADLVVTDPVQAGVMAVMAVAETARFDLGRVRGQRFCAGGRRMIDPDGRRDERGMDAALLEARRCLEWDDVPVGDAVFVGDERLASAG